jgi:hypothetical protein
MAGLKIPAAYKHSSLFYPGDNDDEKRGIASQQAMGWGIELVSISIVIVIAIITIYKNIQVSIIVFLLAIS